MRAAYGSMIEAAGCVDGVFAIAGRGGSVS